MEENSSRVYVAPPGFKSGRLIFGMYHAVDLIIIAAGTLVTIIGCLICFNNLSGSSLIVGCIIFACIGGLCWILTTNYSVYHNIMGFLFEYWSYLTAQHEYIFEGIVYYDEEKENE